MEWYAAWQHIGDFCVLCCGRITQASCCCQVNDFIHTYIYMDFIELVKLPKFTSMMLSFIISAILHEYIVTVVMGFFLPILFVLFGGPGILFIGLTRRKTARIWNVFMWIMLSIGTAMLMVKIGRATCRESVCKY